MVKLPTNEEMLEAGVHFGHQAEKWHPKMEPFIFTVRNGVHIINLDETRVQLKKALEFVENSVASGAVILFLGTKRQAREYVEAAAKACGMPYIVEHWIGGLLTNFNEIKRSIKKYHSLKKGKETGEWSKYVKKEQIKNEKELQKLEARLFGISTLEKIPEIIFVADMRGDKTATMEAKRIGVNVVGLCDTNINPEFANYVIPGNDDGIRSIAMISNLVAEAVNEGKKEYAKVLAEKNAAKELEKAKEVPKKKERKAEVVVNV